MNKKVENLMFKNVDLYEEEQIIEIVRGVKSGVSIEKYSDYRIPASVMREIRIGLENGIDMSCLANMTAEQLREEREKFLKEKSEIEALRDRYRKAGYSESQIAELIGGYRSGLNYLVYDCKLLSPESMNLARLGLSAGIDASIYAKSELPYKAQFIIYKALLEQKEREQHMNYLIKQLYCEYGIKYD